MLANMPIKQSQFNLLTKFTTENSPGARTEITEWINL
jgi:hypothetical protein